MGDRWTFITNHAAVLLCVARDPGMRVRDIATAVGVTEGAVMRILTDLVDEGYVERTKIGRRNVYQVNGSQPFRHRIARSFEIGLLLDLLQPSAPVSPSDAQAPKRARTRSNTARV